MRCWARCACNFFAHTRTTNCLKLFLALIQWWMYPKLIPSSLSPRAQFYTSYVVPNAAPHKTCGYLPILKTQNLGWSYTIINIRWPKAKECTLKLSHFEGNPQTSSRTNVRAFPRGGFKCDTRTRLQKFRKKLRSNFLRCRPKETEYTRTFAMTDVVHRA